MQTIDTDPSTRVERWSRLLGIEDAQVMRASFWAATDADRMNVLEQRVILQDVTRTRTDEVFFTGETIQMLLREALCSFCAYHKLEYMQGMNEVLAPLLAINLVSSPGTYAAVSNSLSAANSPATTPSRAAPLGPPKSGSVAGKGPEPVEEDKGGEDDEGSDEEFAGFDCEMIVPEGHAVVEAYERRCKEADIALEAAAEYAGKTTLSDAELRKALVALATAQKAQEKHEEELKKEQTKQHAILQYNAAFVLFERIVLSMCSAIFSPSGILALQGQLASFHLLLFYVDAPLANFLSFHGMRCDVYAQSWLITLFSRRTPVELALYVWEHMLQREYCANPQKLICLSVAFIVQQRRFLADVTQDELPQCLVRLRFKSEEEVDAVFALAENIYNAAPAAQLRDSRLCGFGITEYREVLLKDLMTRSCAMSNATDVASYLMDETAEEKNDKFGTVVEVKRSARPLRDNQYSQANAAADVAKLPVATILVATPPPTPVATSTSWSFLDNVVTSLDSAINAADRALDDDAIIGAVNNIGSKFSSLLGGNKADITPVQEKEKLPEPMILTHLQALQRAPRYLLIDCRSPEELKTSKLTIEGALPVSPLNISDICRVAVLKQKAGQVAFTAKPLLTMESSRTIYEFLLFCSNFGGMHFILFDSDEAKSEDDTPKKQPATDLDRSKRPTFHLATALLVLGFSRISIVHGPNVQSAATEQERQQMHTADLLLERAEDEERVMLSLPVSVQYHVRTSLASSTDGFHALMVELLGRKGAVIKPLSSKYDTRGTNVAATAMAAAYSKPTSGFASGESSSKVQDFYISTKQSSLIVDKVNRVRKMLDAIEEKEAIAKIKKAMVHTENASNVNKDAKQSSEQNAVPQWGNFLGGTVSSLSSLSLDAFPEMPSLRQLFDSGSGDSNGCAPKSALETNSGADKKVDSCHSDSNDGDRYSSAAIKERLERDALQQQERAIEPAQEQQKSPQSVPPPPSAGNSTTPTSISAPNSVNNSPSRVLDASDPANKIRLMKYVVLSKAKSSPTMATDKKELRLILNGLRELKNNLNNIERLGSEFGGKLDARVESFQLYRLQKSRLQQGMAAVADAADGGDTSVNTDNC